MQDEQSLRAIITRTIETIMAGQADAGTTRFLAGEEGGALADTIANALIREAVSQGLPELRGETIGKPLSGGNTAEMVAFYTLKENFAFKLDRKTPKLAEEGKTMRAIRNDPRLPRRYREAWPVIHAIRDTPPYAYLFEYFPKEDGWISLEDRLFPNKDDDWKPEGDPERLIAVVLDYMFEGFEAGRMPRIQPNLAEDYLDRIRTRLNEAARLDGRFGSMALTINGEPFEPWEDLLDRLEANAGAIAAIAPGFTTTVHGDPNPGNLMLRERAGEWSLKFIDPKEWGIGDYLFDVTKLTHFLLGTGPIEKPASGKPAVSFKTTGEDGTLTYDFARPAFVDRANAMCRERVARFARLHDDTGWEARYELGLAANLIGLPVGRLKKGREDAALILYGEGLVALKRFLSRIEAETGAPSAAKTKTSATIGPVVPPALQTVRERLLREIHDARETFDRRGFRAIHYAPPRPNDSDKPVELSLEHEGRLKPAGPEGAEPLRTMLRDGQGQAWSQLMPGGDPWFDGLVVKRFDRPPGPQSSDLYYDLADKPRSKGWIGAMLSLRERRMTSKFMTWGKVEDKTQHPLNLELPFVSYGDTGVIARLEFNWIDALDLTIADFRKAAASGLEDHGNPLTSAARVVPIAPSPHPFTAALSHTTFREKFALIDLERPEAEQERFHINIDDVTVQSLRTGHVTSFCDVDIAPCDIVDEAVLSQLVTLTQMLARRFDLVPVEATKAWRGLAVTFGEEDG
ncbi:phosphotransferase [Fulvimarina sp. MAC3]|uniref:phosphotransferase n=1 Tax=Fulvimarina sp. MAC3 TaxID=3148887 RepID=UPI0031FDDD9A